MASTNSICTECEQSLVNGRCVNKQCSKFADDAFGSLVPGEFLSMDPTQIIDYTGTIGVNPGDVDSADAHESVFPTEEAQTRLVDDDFYQQIQSIFPAESGSGSRAPSGSAQLEEEVRPSADPDASQSLSVRGVRGDLTVEEFVPPVRDIRFPSDSASLEQVRDADPDSLEGDEYHIIEKLGEGGYGIVFEAEQMALNRPVAVKVLKPKRKKRGSRTPSASGTGTGELQRRRDQFLHEAKITARLQHPNIVPLYDFGINTQGQLFYSMKKVERRAWSSVLHDPAKLLGIDKDAVDATADREAINKNVEIFDRVCDAMAYSHAMKIIHRDLKPDNIMIGDYGEVLLIDFGMALDFSAGQPEFSAGGTLVYMSPEMAVHFAKQKEIQVAAQKTAQRLGVDEGSIFLDKSNLLGIGKLAEELIKKSQDQGVLDLAETLIRLDSEEKQLASKIGYASDIYLLGAILYQIAVGHPPHYFPIAACKQGRKEKFQKELWLALKNGFQQYQQIHDPLRISLRNIAVKAMRTEPEKRYQTVEELQEAIKDFQLQVQSLEMTETGKEELDKAKGGEGYQHLLPALESFRGATALWPEGREANTLQVQAACEYAGRAHHRKDFDAGLSILDEYVVGEDQRATPVVEVRNRLQRGKRRRARNRTLAAVGWVAAVALPIAVYIVGYLGTIQLQDRADLLAKQVTQQEEQVKQANARVTEAKGLVEQAEAATTAAEEKKLAAEAKATELAQQETRLKEEISGLNTEKETLSAEKQTLVADKQSLQNEKQTLEIEKTNLETAVAAAAIAQNAAEVAAAESKRKADKYQFDADFGEFNTNVLTLPLDLRTGKLNVAANKLDRLQNSNAKPHFKNGWLVKHFLKRTQVAGTEVKPGQAARIVDIVSRPDSGQAIVVGIENGIPAAWELGANGESTKLDINLPTHGQIADASISGDGKWLALAIDNVVGDDKSKGHLWVINLSDSKQANRIVSSEGVIGCQVVEFAPGTTDTGLATVEELSGHRGLKQRVQVVTRAIVDNRLTELSTTPVSATTRDEGRVRYLATATWNEGRPVVALAYQALDDDGADVFRMESLQANREGVLTSSLPVVVGEFPTAIHAIPQGDFFAGYADGHLEQFQTTESSTEFTTLENRNESEIVRIESTADGRLISGSDNGIFVVWNPNLTFFKRIAGQPGELSALAAGKTDPESGFTLFSGDIDGNVRFWQPETNKHESKIRKDSEVTITSAAIDQGLAAAAVPATAYGTKNGQVYYFDSQDMMLRRGGKRLDREKMDANATFRFKSPFESFGTTFNDFDSMGIVDDHFVLIKDDGTFYVSLIDTQSKNGSARSQSLDLSGGQNLIGNFLPLLASVHDRNYFYSTNPKADDQLLYWTKSGSRFASEDVQLPSGLNGRVKRLAMSPDGRWLAVVRQLGRTRVSGEYFAEIYEIDRNSGALELAETTDNYRVGDPAFVGFSADSQEMILNFHRLGVDRETWLERRQFQDGKWNEVLPRQMIEDRKVDLVDWEDQSDVERLITKFNNDYFLISRTTPVAYSAEPFRNKSVLRREKLRTVRPVGNGQDYYVLSTNRLDLYNGTTLAKGADFESPIEEARDLRVYGKNAVLLDKNGFHLIDANLNYVTKLAARKVEVKDVSLSTGRLAVLYTNNLCRVWDVRGDTPQGLGEIENVTTVRLSPDGKWAACESNGQLQVFPIDSKFDKPKLNLPMGGAAFKWTGRPDSELLAASVADGKVTWKQVAPATGAVVDRTDMPTDINDFVDFELAPNTETYVAIQTSSSMSLWVTGDAPFQLTRNDHEFDASKLNDVKAISFSEIKMENPLDIGTRLVVLADDGSVDAAPELRIYLLAKEAPEQAVPGEPMREPRYRVVEIEGALEKSEGRDLIDAGFSGDGRSLIQVDERGTTTLLSQ